MLRRALQCTYAPQTLRTLRLRSSIVGRGAAARSITEVARLQHDRRAVRGAGVGPPPRFAVARQRARIGEALGGDEPLESGQPVMIVGLAGIRIAGGLRLLDFRAERRGPLGCGKYAALQQRPCERESLR